MTPKPSAQEMKLSRDELGAAIHDAKIRCCWDKTRWDQRRSAEPWEKKNIAAPNEPWHDIAGYAKLVEDEINAGS